MQTVWSEPRARLAAPAAAPLFPEAFIVSLQVKKNKGLVKRGHKVLQPRSSCALLRAPGIKVAHAQARRSVLRDCCTCVSCKEFPQNTCLVSMGRLSDTVHNCGENGWSQYTNKGGQLSAAGLDVASSSPRSGGHVTRFPEQAEPCFLGGSKHAKFRRRREKILPFSARRRETLGKMNGHQWLQACSVPGSVARTSRPLFPVLFVVHPWGEENRLPWPLVVVAVSLPSGAVCGLSRSCTHRQHPHPPAGWGIRLAS